MTTLSKLHTRNINSKLIIWFLIIFILPITLYAQTVSNVTVAQVDKTIHVSYDLDKQAEISLHLSIDGGKTYTELHQLSGDVGKNVAEGHKTIVWDVLAEKEKFVEDKVVFLVRAKPVLSLPVVLTISVIDITSYSATATGDISSTGGSEITSTGFCWSKKAKPTIYDSHTKGSAKWFFSSTLSNLSPKSKYYVRAYATNSVGIAYGEQVVFKTNQETKSKTSYSSTKNVAQYNPTKNKQYNPRPFIKGTRFQTYFCMGLDFIGSTSTNIDNEVTHFEASWNLLAWSFGIRIYDYGYIGILSNINRNIGQVRSWPIDKYLWNSSGNCWDTDSKWSISLHLDLRGSYPINKLIQPYVELSPGVEFLREGFKNPSYAIYSGLGVDIERFTVCIGYYFVYCQWTNNHDRFSFAWTPIKYTYHIARHSMFLKLGLKIGKLT